MQPGVQPDLQGRLAVQEGCLKGGLSRELSGRSGRKIRPRNDGAWNVRDHGFTKRYSHSYKRVSIFVGFQKRNWGHFPVRARVLTPRREARHGHGRAARFSTRRPSASLRSLSCRSLHPISS